MTPTERNAARADCETPFVGVMLGPSRDAVTGTTQMLERFQRVRFALEKALYALDQRDALLRDIRDHVQQCCGCLTYGDWLDKISATIGEPQERLCECAGGRTVYPCKVGNLAGRYVCTTCGEPIEPAPTSAPS